MWKLEVSDDDATPATPVAQTRWERLFGAQGGRPGRLPSTVPAEGPGPLVGAEQLDVDKSVEAWVQRVKARSERDASTGAQGGVRWERLLRREGLEGRYDVGEVLRTARQIAPPANGAAEKKSGGSPAGVRVRIVAPDAKSAADKEEEAILDNLFGRNGGVRVSLLGRGAAAGPRAGPKASAGASVSIRDMRGVARRLGTPKRSKKSKKSPRAGGGPGGSRPFRPLQSKKSPKRRVPREAKGKPKRQRSTKIEKSAKGRTGPPAIATAVRPKKGAKRTRPLRSTKQPTAPGPSEAKRAAAERKRREAWSAAERVAGNYWMLRTMKRVYDWIRAAAKRRRARRAQLYDRACKVTQSRVRERAWRAWRTAHTAAEALRARRVAALKREQKRREQIAAQRAAAAARKLEVALSARRLRALTRVYSAWRRRFRFLRSEAEMRAKRTERAARMDQFMASLMSRKNKAQKLPPLRAPRQPGGGTPGPRTSPSGPAPASEAKVGARKTRGVPSMRSRRQRAGVQKKLTASTLKPAVSREKKTSSAKAPTSKPKLSATYAKPSAAPAAATPAASSAATTRAATTKDAPTTRGSTLAQTMSARAEARRQRRAELKRLRDAREAQKRAEVLAQREAAEAERVANLKAERKKRLDKQARVRRRRERGEARRKLQERKWALAGLHSIRANLVFRGWRPWRVLVERQRAARRTADAFRAFSLQRRVVQTWGVRLAGRRALRVRAADAQRKRSLLTAWRAWAAREANARRAAWEHYCRSLLGRAAARWVDVARERMDLRRARDAQKYAAAAQRGDTVTRRYYFRVWQAFVQTRRAERAKARRFSSLKQKANQYLEEMKRRRAAVALPSLDSKLSRREMRGLGSGAAGTGPSSNAAADSALRAGLGDENLFFDDDLSLLLSS